MKLLVIGATGRTGMHVLEQAAARGHEVTAFTRKPELLDGRDDLLVVVRGDATDPSSVREAVAGQDAVIAAVGGSGIARALIATMREAGVRRVVMTSSRSVPATRPRFAVGMAWLIFRKAYVDLARAEGMLEISGLDWTVVRATRLVDRPGKGRVHIDFEADATGGEATLPRADYAMALLDAAEDDAMIGEMPGVCGARAGRA
ncbi:NAD-dependent epimerase/dehydratase family protein [Nonomuraea deserti]|uniref:NAD-dependent epimerase/dehydratase family protein n=1 Tax=Nonomuraea deserti TaxID=1848322 RepID=A0A4R4UHD0_9ACTN|nr:NAD(P)H-binding protein [Nonomuraea deserti]TDC90910.1 NAD-dependent epimerase/dehydratase family protein [Nonomuraea deserti]